MINTDINIKISIAEDVDLSNPKNTDKIKIDISHDNCGNMQLDDFADNFAHLINYVIESYQAVMNEKTNQSEEPNAPTIETKFKNP